MMTADRVTTPERAKGEGSAVARGTMLLFFAGVAAVPFMQPFTLRLMGSAVQPADALFGLVGLAWIAALATGAMKLRRGRFYVYLAAFFGAMLLTTALSPSRSVGRLVIEIYLMGLGVLAYNLVRTGDDLRRTWAVWTATATVTAAAMLGSAALFYAAGLKDPKVNPILWTAGSLPTGNYPRVRGFFLNGNMTGAYLAVSACFAVGLASSSDKHRRLALAAGLAMSAAALFTLSTALGGLAIAIGMFAWRYEAARAKAGGESGAKAGATRALKALLPLAGLFAAALLVYTATYPKRGDAGLSLEPSPRWLTWGSSWESFLRHPMFGNGLGAPLADVHYFAARGVHEHLTDPHNAWLSVAGQMGAVGLAAFVAMLVWLGTALFERSKASEAERAGGFDRAAPRMVLAGAMIVILYQTFSCSLEDMRHVWLAFGLMAGLVEREGASAKGAETLGAG